MRLNIISSEPPKVITPPEIDIPYQVNNATGEVYVKLPNVTIVNDINTALRSLNRRRDNSCKYYGYNTRKPILKLVPGPI